MSEPGRPEFKPTPAMRRKVEEMVSCGMKQADIARVIGIAPNTLTKHFDDELANGLARKRNEIIAMLYKSAKAGNVTAQKKLEEMSRLAGAEADFAKPAREPQLGKKEQAAQAAQTAGADSDWGADLGLPN